MIQLFDCSTVWKLNCLNIQLFDCPTAWLFMSSFIETIKLLKQSNTNSNENCSPRKQWCILFWSSKPNVMKLFASTKAVAFDTTKTFISKSNFWW